MAKKFREARLMQKWKVVEAAAKLGVSQPTLSAWEGERKAPGIENLEKMAELYGVTTDYLLGRTPVQFPVATDPIDVQALPVFHGRPVWSPKYGWLLVNTAQRKLTLPDGTNISFEEVEKIFAVSPSFADTDPPHKTPMTLDIVRDSDQVWVEPISPDCFLRNELRGWYHVKGKWVENEFGNRFYLDTYGAKWLAFSLRGL